MLEPIPGLQTRRVQISDDGVQQRLRACKEGPHLEHATTEDTSRLSGFADCLGWVPLVVMAPRRGGSGAKLASRGARLSSSILLPLINQPAFKAQA